MIFNIQRLAKDIGKSELEIYRTLDSLEISYPGWLGWDSTIYDSIKDMLNQFFQAPNVMVGADPEFEVLNNSGAAIGASRYLSGGTSHSLGTDGDSSIGEIRPKPGSPERVFINIKNLLIQACKALPSNFDIRGGSGITYPIGGHIHFSGRSYSEDLLNKLEHFISVPLNSKSNNRFRLNHGYGGSRAVRNQPHGWEYRTPCSWLAHPDIAKGVLAIAWGLAQLNDAQLDQLHTHEQLYEVLGYRAEFAKKFYALLDTSQTIESIKVFRAWAIEKDDAEETVAETTAQTSDIQEVNLSRPQWSITLLSPDVTQPNIETSDDFNMDVIQSMGLRARQRIRFIGVSARTGRDTYRNRGRFITIPREWNTTNIYPLPRNLRIYGSAASTTIGLSYRLREALGRSSRVGRGRSLYRTVRRALQELIERNIE